MMMFNISESANKRLLQVLSGGQSLLISVTPGGCNGFSYHYDVIQTPSEEMTKVSENPSVYVSNSAQDMLKGGILQYTADDLGSSFFSIYNPNATSKCGCGNSFSTF